MYQSVTIRQKETFTCNCLHSNGSQKQFSAGTGTYFYAIVLGAFCLCEGPYSLETLNISRIAESSFNIKTFLLSICQPPPLIGFSCYSETCDMRACVVSEFFCIHHVFKNVSERYTDRGLLNYLSLSTHFTAPLPGVLRV